MKAIGAVLICLALAVTGGYGRLCDDLSGTWRNQLGSNMTIENIGDSFKFTGQYNTSVESSTGASTISTKISGLVQQVDGGSLIAFNVLWNKGASLTAWVGQCMVCDDQPKIYTTWLLRSLQTPRNRWMSTRINQDTFFRVDDSPKQASGVEDSGNSDLLGKWNSVTGESIEITGILGADGFEGSHKVSDGSHGGEVYGRFAGNESYTALGFAAAHPQNIRGWTGHIYNPQETHKVIETSWLSQSFSNNCDNPRKFVQFGMDYYSKNTADAAPAA